MSLSKLPGFCCAAGISSAVKPAAGPHLSMNIKIMYIVLTTSAPVFYCFNYTQGTDRDRLLTHIAAGLATLCKSPILDRKKKQQRLFFILAFSLRPYLLILQLVALKN